MTDDMIALARRAVVCKGWRWMPGMLFVNENGTRIRFTVELGTHAIGMVQGGGHPSWREPLPMVGVLPDLGDPATLGCLLALVREAYGDPWLHARPDPEELLWYVVTDSGAAWINTEAGALVAALENAP